MFPSLVRSLSRELKLWNESLMLPSQLLPMLVQRKDTPRQHKRLLNYVHKKLRKNLRTQAVCKRYLYGACHCFQFFYQNIWLGQFVNAFSFLFLCQYSVVSTPLFSVVVDVLTGIFSSWLQRYLNYTCKSCGQNRKRSTRGIGILSCWKL